MAIQASLGSQLIVSEVFRRHKLVPRVFYKVPSLGEDSSPRGMALKTRGLVGWMSLRVSPQLSKFRMALSTDALIRCGVADEMNTYTSAAAEDNEYEKAEEYPALLFVFRRTHFSFISHQF